MGGHPNLPSARALTPYVDAGETALDGKPSAIATFACILPGAVAAIIRPSAACPAASRMESSLRSILKGSGQMRSRADEGTERGSRGKLIIEIPDKSEYCTFDPLADPRRKDLDKKQLSR